MSTKMVRTHVILPEDLLARVDQLAGPRKRSEVIAELVESSLKVRERIAAWEEVDKHLPLAWEIPGEDTSDHAEYIGRSRRADDMERWAGTWGREGLPYDPVPEE